MITIWPLYFLRRQSFNRLPRLCMRSLRSTARIIWHSHISSYLKNAMKIRRQNVFRKMSIETYDTETGSNNSNRQLDQKNSKILAIDNTYLRIDSIQLECLYTCRVQKTNWIMSWSKYSLGALKMFRLVISS